MALLFVDSFDHYTTILQKWTSSAGGSIGAFGTNGTQGLRAAASTGQAKTLPGGSKATLIAGVNFRAASMPVGALQILGFRDSATVQTDVRLKSDGTLQITRNGTVLGTGTTALSANVFYFIELKVLFATGATGTATLKINNVQELALTNVQTAATANASANDVCICVTGSGGGNNDWDDLYVCDTSGATNNDFLSALRIQNIMPDGAGNYSQWTSSSSLANFANVDEIPPNDDTDYNSTAGVSNIDTFTYGPITPTSGSIKGIQIGFRVKTDDGGVRNVAPVVRQASVDFIGASVAFNSTTYGYGFQPFDVNPVTSLAWTFNDISSLAEFGYKLTA